MSISLEFLTAFTYNFSFSIGALAKTLVLIKTNAEFHSALIHIINKFNICKYLI